MPNSAECLAALFGTALAGATVVPINARFKAPEMRHILADSEAKVVLTSDLMDAHANLSPTSCARRPATSRSCCSGRRSSPA